jgi:hypothetical protein
MIICDKKRCKPEWTGPIGRIGDASAAAACDAPPLATPRVPTVDGAAG